MKITISNKVASKYLDVLKDAMERITSDVKVETELEKLAVDKKLYKVKPGLTEITIELNDEYLLAIGKVNAKYLPMLFGTFRTMYEIIEAAGEDINDITNEFLKEDEEKQETE